MRREKKVFVRNDRQVGSDVRALEVLVIDKPEPLLRVRKGFLVHRVLELRDGVSHQIHAVVVLLLEHTERDKALESPELLSQWELVERVAFKAARPFSACKRRKRERRKLRKVSPLGLRLRVRRLQNTPNGKAKEKYTQKQDSQHRLFFSHHPAS